MRKWTALMVGSEKRDRVRQLLESEGCTIDQVYPFFRQILTPALLKSLSSLHFSEQHITSVQGNLIAKKQELGKLPLLSQVSVAEYLGYTQHTLLKDTDQMSMAVSLEVREPFFDQDLVEFIMAVPDQLKRSNYPKRLLVEALKPMLPNEIVFRKKQGFLFPWKVWLKNELHAFCDMQIENMAKRSFIHGDILRDYWKRFCNGDEKVRWTEIWLFVVLEYWLANNGME